MNGADKPLVRAAGLVILVALSVVALRSHLPDAPALPSPEQPRNERHSMGWQLLLCGAISLVILLSLRRGQRKPLPPADTPSYLRLRGLTRREAIIAVASVLALLSVVWALLYLTRPTGESPVHEPATASSEPRQPDRAAPPQSGNDPRTSKQHDTSMLILGAALAGLAVMVLVLKRRETNTAVGGVDRSAPAGGADTPSESLAHLVELGLAEVAEPGRDPRTSIIACYAAMERGLTAAPEAAPLASDTPSEVLQRAVHIGALQSHAGTQLVSLFSEARFSPHEMTQTDREAAVRWLQSVLDDLRSRQ